MLFDPRLFAYVKSPICILAFDSIFVCYPIRLFVTLSSLIPLSRGSFDVIVGMDWLSKRKFVIVDHEKVVRIPLEGDEILRFHDELGDALSRKERVKSRRVRGMILAAQSEAFKQENVLAERLHGLDQQMERKGDESLYFMDRIWVLLVGSVMDEAHASSNCRICLRGEGYNVKDFWLAATA
ncbi:hypothetical protein Tco_0661455 [Tanacetum coccineum]